MRPPRTPVEAVLHAARDVTRLDQAFDAEMLGGALLGSVYAIAPGARAAAVRDFVETFLTRTARRRTPAAAAVRQVFAALVPDAPGAARVRAGTQPPAWAGQLGRVRLTGSHGYGDVYGDQTSYVATFRYEDPAVGGPEHAVVALVDHNLGIVKDIHVGPAERIVPRLRELCAADELTAFVDVPAAVLHARVDRYLAVTDELSELPGEGSLATDRVLLGARLRAIPVAAGGPAPEPRAAGGSTAPQGSGSALAAQFLESAEAAAAGLTGLEESDRLCLDFTLGLVLDHAETFEEPDPLRWSPAVVGFFLLDWVHRRAVLDDADAAMLPRVLRGWVAFAARHRGQPPVAAAAVQAAVDELTEEFRRLHASGDRRSEAARAVALLMAEGVDPSDPVALGAWLRVNAERSS